MKPRLSRSLRRILAGVVVCSQMALAVDLDWAGTSNNLVWDTTSQDWVASGTTSPNVAFATGDNVTFGSPQGEDASDTVDVGSDIEAGQVVIDDAYTFHVEQDATVSGVISGTENGSLTKTGAGALTLNATEDSPDSALDLAATEGELILAGTNTYATGTVTDDAVLVVDADAEITFNGAVDAAHLENNGILHAEDSLVLANTTEQGGTVTTPSLTLGQGGNVFTSLTTDLLQVAATDPEAPVVTTEEIAPNTENGSINVQLASVNRKAEVFTIVDVTGDNSGNTTYTIDQATLDMYRAVGLDPVVVQPGNGSLAISLGRIPSRYLYNMASTRNGLAGAKLMEEAFIARAPQWNRKDNHDLAAVLDRMDDLIAANALGRAAGDAAREYDRLAASVAGAGVACLGIAWRTQMERQLRNIRDRISVMKGGISCCTHPDPKAGAVRKPAFTVWANADIDYQNQRGDEFLPGFRLHGIGGTVGMAGRLGEHWILGGAVSGMSGRISSKGYGSDASGHLDSYYASLFTRLDHGCWTHSLNATVGIADVNFKRCVDYGTGMYETRGTPDGLGLGIMYEVARSFRISEDYMASAWWQPVINAAFIHSRIDAYTETGSDAALHVGKQEYNNVVLGVGARMQTVLGRRFFNTDTVFNLRVMGKAITGDRRGEADVSFAGVGGGARVATSERSVCGVEVGGGFAIPLGTCGGNIFAECTAEFMNDYNSVNGVLGYRVGF